MTELTRGGLPEAGTMPSEAVISDTGPDCDRCSWVVVGPGIRSRLKIISASCAVHSEIDRRSWSYDRYRAGQPRPDRRERAGYVQPAKFLGEIADRPDERVIAGAAR
jgi:hypothetical protein